METNHVNTPYSCPSEPSNMAEEPVMDTGWPDALEFFGRHYNPNETVEDAITWEELERGVMEDLEMLFNEKESRSIA